MTYKEKYMADHPDYEWTNELGPGCPSDSGYDTESNEEKNCHSNGGEGCVHCWDREMPKESIDISEGSIGVKYQEKVDTIGDIRDLYSRILTRPFVKFYRGYTDTSSYGWDVEVGDYIKMTGEFWFENPAYDPSAEPSPSKVGEMVGEGAVKAFKDGLKNGIPSRGLRSQIPGVIDEACDISTGPRILDSGNRRQFETGAVRDIHDGKGRCDLLPLDVVGHALCNPTFNYIAQYMREDGDYERLYDALSSSGVFHDYYTLMLEVAKHFEEGCKKYGDNNWQKGIPTHCYVDSAVRHYLKYLRGDKDEPHDRAFCWNIMCCIWTCIHKPELNDYAPKVEDDFPNCQLSGCEAASSDCHKTCPHGVKNEEVGK